MEAARQGAGMSGRDEPLPSPSRSVHGHRRLRPRELRYRPLGTITRSRSVTLPLVPPSWLSELRSIEASSWPRVVRWQFFFNFRGSNSVWLTDISSRLWLLRNVRAVVTWTLLVVNCWFTWTLSATWIFDYIWYSYCCRTFTLIKYFVVPLSDTLILAQRST